MKRSESPRTFPTLEPHHLAISPQLQLSAWHRLLLGPKVRQVNAVQHEVPTLGCHVAPLQQVPLDDRHGSARVGRRTSRGSLVDLLVFLVTAVAAGHATGQLSQDRPER